MEKKELITHIKLDLTLLVIVLGLGFGSFLSFRGLVMEQNGIMCVIGFVLMLMGVFAVPLYITLIEDWRNV